MRLVAFAAVMFAAAPAFADEGAPAGYADDSGPYAALRAGAAIENGDEDIAVAGSVGYAFGGLHVEAEGGYRRMSGDYHPVSDALHDGRAGSELYTVFANAFYEFDAGPVRPYVGGGAGLVVADSRVTLDSVQEPIPPECTGTGPDFSNCPQFIPPVSFENDSVGFAWQAIAGFAFPFIGLEHTDFVVDYRFVSTSGIELGGVDFNSDSHNVTGGVRVHF